jgi:succinate dehydrogenase / fumarate reductase, cytochrome b subunit
MEATTETSEGRPFPFVFNKVGSLLAFAPLGVWTCLHIYDNLSSLKGAEAWEANVTHHEHPLALLVTAIIVLLPLALHAWWGLVRVLTSRPNNLRYGYFENLKYLLQRLSALGVLGFIGAHIWLAFLQPRVMLGHPEPFSGLAAQMRYHMPTLAVYLLGTLGVAYHLGNGLSGFSWNWGLVNGRKAVMRLQKAGIVLFVVVLIASWAAIYGLWHAGADFGPLAD